MDKRLWLYVIELEQNKFFLYDTYCSNEFEVLVIAHMKNDYMKKYKPIDIKEIMILDDHIEILYYLKKYMAKYGIESVRGGSYKNEFLTQAEQQFLENELSIENNSTENQKEEDYIREIVYKYGSRHWNQIEIDEEVNHLTSMRESYRKDLENMNKVNWITDSILYDIGWIRKLASSPTSYLYVYKSCLHNKYYEIIKNLKKITKIFIDYDFIIDYDSPIYLKNPEFVFDNCILSITNSYKDKLEELCDKFQLMITTLINRKMEYEFHIDSYEKDIEWKIQRSIYFLTNYSRKIPCKV
jgi:hypothetical protein